MGAALLAGEVRISEIWLKWFKGEGLLGGF